MVAQFAAPGILTALRTALGGAASVGRAGLVSAGTIASKLIPGKTELPEQQTITTTVEKTDDEQDNEKLINDATEAVAETRRLNQEAQSSLEPGLNLFQQIKGILESIKEDTSTVIKEMNADEAREIKAIEKAESLKVEKDTEAARKPLFQSAKEVTKTIVQGTKSLLGGLLKGLIAALLLDSLAKAFTGKGILELAEEYIFQPIKDKLSEKVTDIGEKTGLNLFFGGIKDFFGGLKNILNPTDNVTFIEGVEKMNTGIAKFFDSLLNPITQFFGQKDLLQEGMEKLRQFESYIMSPQFGEDLDNIGTDIVNTFKKLGTDLKNAFSDPATMFPSLKSQERRINELKGSGFTTPARQKIINELVKEGEIKKKGFTTKYNELEPQEKVLVDKLVEEERDKALLEVDPKFDIKKFREKEKLMNDLYENSDLNPDLPQGQEKEKSAIITDGPTEDETEDEDKDIPRIRISPTPEDFQVPEAVPEKDADKISMGANMRNYAMDPKPIAMMAVTRNSPTSVNNNNSSTVVSNTTNVKKGGGGGSIGTRNADTSLYSGLTPAFMQGVRG
jgi:hypothetical protein